MYKAKVLTIVRVFRQLLIIISLGLLPLGLVAFLYRLQQNRRSKHRYERILTRISAMQPINGQIYHDIDNDGANYITNTRTLLNAQCKARHTKCFRI